MKNKIYVKGQHGESYTNLFNRWASMINRCSPKWKYRKFYFDKGISVCDEWKIYLNFKEWALANGYSKELQLDRKDNSKGYSPQNCRFVTQLVNNSNRSNTIYVEYKGEIKSLTLLCIELNIDTKTYNNIRRRINSGYTFEQAYLKPLGKYNASSKYWGVTFNKRGNRKWRVIIRVNGKNKAIGSFIDENSAALAFNKANILYNGENDKFNIIQPGC